ncbi:MAG: tetratricopeptide repeat protein [Desulfocapsaceae bacterium]|nr:tetratricopeptide repeat protein [Desulfocapsaceae bacterium]
MSLFPPPQSKQALTENDFKRFSLPFSRILKRKIPTASKIIFIAGIIDIKANFQHPETAATILDFLRQSQKNPDRVYVDDNNFILPFPVGDTIIGAVIQGVDPFLTKKADHAWLIEMRNSALDEFSLLKRERLDQDTGLLNAANLGDILEFCEEATNITLMLIELYPRVRSASEAILFSRKAALALINFIDYRFPLHHLGHGVFALVIEEAKDASQIGTMLLSWLRQENFPRVHIGCSRKVTDHPEQLSLLDAAWQALQVACRRGPFSFCDFSLLSHPEQHPLRRPSKRILARFSNKWRNSDFFSIVQFQEACSSSLRTHLSTAVENLIIDEDDVYVYLNGMNSQKAIAWVQRTIDDIKEKTGEDISCSAGISSYPLAGFSKTEILHSCRKALRHADFFGAGSVVVFDAVSQNISGDIFFSDGDLESAVREYKKGLQCDANNINLLNSLGVTYALMDKHKTAHQFFGRVLELDPDNFMALYNLGLGENFLGHRHSALVRFERALAVYPEGSEDVQTKRDLQLQVGKLYCTAGEFQKAIDILLDWHQNAKGVKNAGRAFRYLGIAFHTLKKKDEATVWLQRALQFDQFDAEAMGLLGEIYLEQGQGNDISLSLCEKSVELDPQNLKSRLRLAKAQTACRKFSAARSNLRACQRNRELKAEALLQNGLICRAEGQTRKARNWFIRLMRLNNLSPYLRETAQSYLETQDE